MSPATRLPPAFDALLGAVEALPMVAALRTSELAYPLVNAAHVVGVALLFGAIVPLDLRLLGGRRRAGAVEGLATLLLPVAIFGLLLAMSAGLLLFATDARAYAASALFRTKMILLAAQSRTRTRSAGWTGGRNRRRLGPAWRQRRRCCCSVP